MVGIHGRIGRNWKIIKKDRGNSGSKSKETSEEWIISVESTISTKWTKAKQILRKRWNPNRNKGK